MRLLLGYPRGDFAALHAALAGRGHEVLATLDGLGALLDAAARTTCDLAVLWANLAGSPADLEAALGRLPVPAVVVVPPELGRAEAQIAAMGDPSGRAPAAVGAAGYDDVERVLDLVEAAARKLRPARSQLSAPQAEPLPTPPPASRGQAVLPQPAPAPAVPSLQTRTPPPDSLPEGRLVLAVWSGSSGGTGKSTIAAEIAGLAAARGVSAALVGLNEPGGIVAALEARPRPDLLDLAQGEGGLQKRGALDLVPGPCDPARWQGLEGGGLALQDALLDALAHLRATHALLVLDLPPALSGPVVDAALTLATRALYVMRPAAADGAVAARALLALARMQKPAALAWSMVNGSVGAGENDICRALAELGVAAPAAVGSVPFHPGVLAARNRRQLLFEAAADGVPCVAAASACAACTSALLGWEPAQEETRLRLPRLRLTSSPR